VVIPKEARNTVEGSSFGRPCIACTEYSVLVQFPTLLHPPRVCQVFKLLCEEAVSFPLHLCNAPGCRFKLPIPSAPKRIVRIAKHRGNCPSFRRIQGECPNTLLPAYIFRRALVEEACLGWKLMGGGLPCATPHSQGLHIIAGPRVGCCYQELIFLEWILVGMGASTYQQRMLPDASVNTLYECNNGVHLTSPSVTFPSIILEDPVRSTGLKPQLTAGL
jgi:hypothetical protein